MGQGNDRDDVAMSWTETTHESLLLVVEDAHLADAGSVERLEAIVARGPRVHLQILVTARPGEIAAGSAIERVLQRFTNDGALALTLRPLSTDASRALVQLSAPTLDPVVQDSIVERSGGNPFFLLALIRASIRNSGRIVGAVDAVREHLANVEPSCRSAVAVLAVSGTSVDVPLIAAGMGVSSASAEEALTLASRHGLVIAEPGGYRLAHQLIAESSPEWIEPAMALNMKASLAAELAARDTAGSVVDAETWARLATESLSLGDPRRVFAACLVAAGAAKDRFDWTRAADWLAKAFDAAGLTDLSSDERLRILLDQGRFEADAGLRDRARATLLRAAAFARGLGNMDAMAEAAVSLAGVYARVSEDELLSALIEEVLRVPEAVSTPRLVRLLSALSLARFVNLDPSGPPMAERAVAIAREHGDAGVLAGALSGLHLASSAYTTQEYVALADETIVLAREAKAFEPLVLGLLNRHKERLVLGDRIGARADLHEARRMISAGSSAKLRWIVRTWDCVDAMIDGRFDEAQWLGRSALSVLGEDHPDASAVFLTMSTQLEVIRGIGTLMIATEAVITLLPEAGAVLRGSVAHGYVLNGDPDRAMLELDRLAAADYGGEAHSRFWVLGLVAACEATRALSAGQHGRMLAERLLPYAEEQAVLRLNQGGALYFGPVHHSIGIALLAAGDTAGALRHLTRAVRSCENFEAPFWANRSQAVLDTLV